MFGRRLAKRQRQFLELEQWFDRLPEEDQSEIWSLHERTKARPGVRLLPSHHGDDQERQLDAAVERFSSLAEPFALVRIGDSDLALLGAGFIPPTSPGNLGWYRVASGFDRSGLAIRQDLIAAVRNAEIVGLHQHWEPVARSTATMLTMLGLPVPHPNGVEVHLPYRLLVGGHLFDFLAERRVVLVGLLAPQLADAWRSASFCRAYEAWGPVETTEVVGAIPTRRRDDGGAIHDYEQVIEQLEDIDYDVALLACGVTAKPLAWKVRQTGHTALDVGFVFDALLGDPEREVRPSLRDARWPEETWL